MRLASLIRSDPFRAASRGLAVFAILYVTASWALVRSVETTLLDDLQSRIQTETELLNQIYRDEGQRGLVEAIERLDDMAPNRAYGLFDGRLSLTGPISTRPDFLGFDTRELNVLSGGRVAGRYVLWVDQVDALTLVVGRDDNTITQARWRLITGLGLFGFLLALTTLGLGLWAARASQRRLDEMEHVLNTVSKGDLAARLPAGQTNDQFDRVARRINANLGQLQRLVTNLKSTATAIAHDLKTPLSHAQIAMHQAADAVDDNSTAREKVEDAIEATDALNRLFETILRLSRIQTTSDRSQFTAASLHSIAQDAVSFFDPLANENAQRLTLGDDDAQVLGDPGMIRQAVVNLIQNACLHAGKGAAITVTITQGKTSASLTVSDTGPGISPDQIDAVRAPFARAAADRGAPGHGLGLAIVSAVADAHDATLTLANTDHGFAATLSFPNLKNI